VERVHRGLSDGGAGGTVLLQPSAVPATTGAGARLRRLTSRAAAPYWQAAPLALVFAFFFVLPLVVTVVVSLWRYNEYSITRRWSGTTTRPSSPDAWPSCRAFA
jgi:hypothetical protein